MHAKGLRSLDMVEQYAGKARNKRTIIPLQAQAGNGWFSQFRVSSSTGSSITEVEMRKFCREN